MLRTAAALFLVLASIALWVGCVTNSSNYVFAALPISNAIASYRQDPNSGILTPLAGSPFVAGQSVESLVVHPSNKFLYAANSGESDVSLFTISSGILTEVTPRTPVGISPIQLVMDTAGTTLYVANIGGGGSVYIFSIDASTGKLSNPGGSLTPVIIPIGTTPLNMKLSPSGNFLYVTGSENSGLNAQGVVEAWSLSAPCAGVSAPCLVNSTLVFTGGVTPQGLAISPNGSFLYTANFGSDSISEFSIGSDGSLTPLSASPLGETYAGPVDLRLDNSGKYLYVANKTSGNIAGYSVGSDGGLTLLSTSPFVTAAGTSFIASDPAGKYLVVGIQGSSGQLESFALDSGSGTLRSVATYPIPNAASSIAVAP